MKAGPVDARLFVSAPPDRVIEVIRVAFRDAQHHRVTRVGDAAVVSWYSPPGIVAAMLFGMFAVGAGELGAFVIEATPDVGGSQVHVHGRAMAAALALVRDALEPLGVTPIGAEALA
jgi:uncharacterized membrane protein